MWQKREHVHTTHITSSTSNFGGQDGGGQSSYLPPPIIAIVQASGLDWKDRKIINELPPRYVNVLFYQLPPSTISLLSPWSKFLHKVSYDDQYMRPSRSKKLLITTMRYMLPTLQLRLCRRSIQLLLGGSKIKPNTLLPQGPQSSNYYLLYQRHSILWFCYQNLL